MDKTTLLNKLLRVTRQPFMVFANLEQRPDNTQETLKLLAKETDVTAGRIAEYLDIKPSSVTQIIKKLVQKGAVERIKSTTDARITFVQLTAKGQEMLTTQGSITGDLQDAIFKGFSEEELANFEAYLDRLEQNTSSPEFMAQIDELFHDERTWENFGRQSSARFMKMREQMQKHHFEHFNGPFPHSFDPRKDFNDPRKER